MNKLFFLTLIPSLLFGCSTIRALNSSEVLDELYKDPKIEIGSIEITNYKNLPEDSNQAKDFLKNIILSNKHRLSDSPDYIVNLSIKEQSYSKKLDQIYTVTVTMNVLAKSSEKTVYRGILIKESTEPFNSSYRLFKLIKESYSKFKSNCRVKRQEVGLQDKKNKE